MKSSFLSWLSAVIAPKLTLIVHENPLIAPKCFAVFQLVFDPVRDSRSRGQHKWQSAQFGKNNGAANGLVIFRLAASRSAAKLRVIARCTPLRPCAAIQSCP